jgi:hypothetical protein
MPSWSIIKQDQVDLTLKRDGVISEDISYEAPLCGVYRLSVALSGWSNGASLTITYNDGKETCNINLTRVLSRWTYVDLHVYFPTIINIRFTATMQTRINLKLEKPAYEAISLDDVLPNKNVTCSDSVRKHLFVMSHGNHGISEDLYDLGERLRASFHASRFFKNHELYILYPKSNEWFRTHDGIEVCSDRLTLEIKNFCNKYLSNKEKVVFSMLGHSLGGLIIRHAIVDIFKDDILSDILIPVSLMTISTPHLGARKPFGTFTESFVKKSADIYMHYFLGPTGRELCLSDGTVDKAPLLLRMSDPSSEYIAMLNKFRSRTVVGASYYDHIVPHCSALITSHMTSEPPAFGEEGFKVSSISGFGPDDNHDHIILFKDQKQIEFNDPIHDSITEKTDEMFLSDNKNQTEFMYKILYNLQQVHWRRISLEFSLVNWRQAIGVHDMTINKRQRMIKQFLSTQAKQAPAECVILLSRVLLIDHYKACVDMS